MQQQQQQTVAVAGREAAMEAGHVELLLIAYLSRVAGRVPCNCCC